MRTISTECQQRDWKKHKEMCNKVKKTGKQPKNRELNDFQRQCQDATVALMRCMKTGNKREEAMECRRIGISYQKLCQYTQSIEFHEKELAIFKELGDKSEEARAYDSLSDVYHDLGQFDKAMEFTNTHLFIAKSLGNKVDECQAYNSLGKIHFKMGHFTTALEAYQTCLAIAVEVGDAHNVCSAHEGIGFIYLLMEQADDAMVHFQRAINLAKKWRIEMGSSLSNIANAYAAQGEYEKAIEMHQEDLRDSHRLGDRAGKARANGNLGVTYDRMDQTEKALDFYLRCLNICEEVGDRASEAAACCNLGAAYGRLGRFEKALEFHEKHLVIALENDDISQMMGAYCNLSHICYKMGKFEKAYKYGITHLNHALKEGDTRSEATASGNIGNALARAIVRVTLEDDAGGETTEIDETWALSFLLKQLSIALELGNRAEETDAYINLGNYYEGQQQLDKAIDYYTKYHSASIELFDRAGVRIASDKLANLGRGDMVTQEPQVST